MQSVHMERTRLYGEGIPNAIIATVARRSHDGMVITQPLPFLRLDTAVTESGRRARIARVAIAMDGDVPELLLELHHEPEEDDDDTVETFTPGVSSMPARTEATVPYELGPSKTSTEIVLVDDPPFVPSIVRLPTPIPWYARLVRWVVTAFRTLTSTPV